MNRPIIESGCFEEDFNLWMRERNICILADDTPQLSQLSEAWWNVTNLQLDAQEKCDDWLRIRDAGKLRELFRYLYED